MENQISSTEKTTEQTSDQTTTVSNKETTVQATSGGPSAEKAASEPRQAYGTAKTENLRDSGLWRIFLPTLVVLFCVTLIAIPLIILVPLLLESLNPSSPGLSAGYNFAWLWITMIVLSIGAAAIVIWGFCKIFLTQAGNYHKV